jgi:ketosteroid isomerase-like protein
MRTTLLSVPLLAVMLACQQAAPNDDAAAIAPLDTTQLRSTVRARSDAFAAAVLGGQVDSVAQYVSNDIVLLEPGVDVKGKEAFRSLLVDLTKTLTITTFELTPEAHIYGPDQVAEFGRYHEVYRDKTAKETVCNCQYVTLWRREADGEWRMTRIHAGPRG